MSSADEKSHLEGGVNEQRRVNPQLFVAGGALVLLALIIVGALMTGRGAEASIDGITKFQFKIFEASRQEVVKEVPKPEISQAIPDGLRDRINRSARQLVGAYILWVDDGGALQNSWERRALGSLGVAVDTVRSTDEATDLLQSGLAYDVVITDFARPEDVGAACYPGSTTFVSAGCRLIQRVHQVCGEGAPPIIVYAANLDESAGQPARVLGMTNRFDRLIGYVLDGLERRPTEFHNLETGACVRTPV